MNACACSSLGFDSVCLCVRMFVIFFFLPFFLVLVL